MLLRTCAAALLLTFSCIGRAQVLEPLDLAKLLFGPDSVPDMEAYIAGEYEGQPNGRSISDQVSRDFLLLGQTSNKAVVALTLLDSLGQGVDTYLHFSQDTSWRMTAFRGLALTGIIAQMQGMLERMTPEQVDEMIRSAGSDKDGNTLFSSRAEYEHLLGQCRLTLALDADIIKHFHEHRSMFEEMKDAALRKLERSRTDEGRGRIFEEKEMETTYAGSFLTSVSRVDLGQSPCLDFLIGGMVDNSVGYLYVRNKADLPEMDPGGYIMIREIGGGWYIYKTT